MTVEKIARRNQVLQVEKVVHAVQVKKVVPVEKIDQFH